jgi:hypothetical protein
MAAEFFKNSIGEVDEFTLYANCDFTSARKNEL